MPALAVGSIIPKTFYSSGDIPTAERVYSGINGYIGSFGNSNCFYLTAFADLDNTAGSLLGFQNFYANYIIDGELIEIPNAVHASAISGAGKENLINIDTQIIKDGVFIGAGIFAYNSDPDPGAGTYGFSSLVYDGDTFTTEVSGASDQTFFDAATEFGNNNTSTIINRDDLDTFYFGATGGCYQVSLTTGVYSFIPLAVEIKQFLFCNDDICFYQGTDNIIYDLDDEEYTFDDLEMYESFPSVSLLFDGTYHYLINNDNAIPTSYIYRFMYNGTTYDTIQITDGIYIFGTNIDGRLTGGIVA